MNPQFMDKISHAQKDIEREKQKVAQHEDKIRLAVKEKARQILQENGMSIIRCATFGDHAHARDIPPEDTDLAWITLTKLVKGL